jgi:hypothetical protein
MEAATHATIARAKSSPSAHTAECAAILERGVRFAKTAVGSENRMLSKAIAVDKRFT